VDVGPEPPNLAVTAVRKLDDRVEATIRNNGSQAREVRARLTVDGRPSGEATASPGPNQSVDVAFPPPQRGTIAAVSIDDPDGVQADNTRYVLLSGTARPRVLVITGSGDPEREGFYVRHALAAGEKGGRGYAVDGTSGAQLSTSGEDRLSDYAAAILVSTRGLERRGREMLASYVRDGGGLVVATGPDVDGDVASDVLGPETALRMTSVDDAGAGTPVRALAPSDVRHPVFEPFAGATATLALVQFRKAARIQGTGCETLARFTNGDTALIECSAGEGRALVIASDLDNRWNDFPLHASFVPFVHEAVRYVSSARTRASEYFVGDTPAGVPRRPGVHLLENNRESNRPGALPRQVVVNVDPRESDPARITVEEFQSVATRLRDDGAGVAQREARQQEDRQHLWRYALVLMAMTLAVEGFIAGRTA
jgi:hypothetical protein